MIQTTTPIFHTKDLGRHESRALTIESKGEEQKIPCIRCEERSLSCVKYGMYAACNNCTRMRRKCIGRKSSEEHDILGKSGKASETQRTSMEKRSHGISPEQDPAVQLDIVDVDGYQRNHPSDPARMEWREDEFTQDLFSNTAINVENLKRKRPDDGPLNMEASNPTDEKRQKAGVTQFKPHLRPLKPISECSSPIGSSYESTNPMLDLDGQTKLDTLKSPMMSNRHEIETLLNELDDAPSTVNSVQQDSQSPPSSRARLSSNDSGDATSPTSNQDDGFDNKDPPLSPTPINPHENIGIQVVPCSFTEKTPLFMSEVSVQTISACEPSAECPGTLSLHLNGRGKCFDRHPFDGRDCGCQIFYPQASSDKRCLCGHWFVFHAPSVDGRP